MSTNSRKNYRFTFESANDDDNDCQLFTLKKQKTINDFSIIGGVVATSVDTNVSNTNDTDYFFFNLSDSDSNVNDADYDANSVDSDDDSDDVNNAKNDIILSITDSVIIRSDDANDADDDATVSYVDSNIDGISAINNFDDSLFDVSHFLEFSIYGSDNSSLFTSFDDVDDYMYDFEDLGRILEDIDV